MPRSSLRSWVVVLTFLLSCGTGDQAPEDIMDTDVTAECILSSGRMIPAGMSFGDDEGCNQCWCEAAGFGLGCEDSRCEPVCTAAACPQEESVGTATCTSDNDCGPPGLNSPTCFFDPGCINPQGYCVRVQNGCGSRGQVTPWDPQNPHPERFCGCDGITYVGSCPLIPYAHPGRCS